MPARLILVWGALAAAAWPAGIVVPPGLEPRFQSPPGIEWGFFRNADGARLRYSQLAAAPAVRGTAVLVTGYGEFGEKYFEVMRELTARGYTVWQLDWRGHGGSDRYLAESQKAHSLGVEHDVNDLDRFVTTVVRPEPGRPLFLVAHSMGGNISLRYLHDHPGRFAFAVLSSPFLSLAERAAQGLPLWVVRSIVWSACTFGFGESWAKGNGLWNGRAIPDVTHDPVRGEVQRLWFQANPGLRIGGVTNGWVRAFLRSVDTIMDPRYLAEIRTPILLGSAQDDVLTRPAVHAAACPRMSDCRLLKINGASHELFTELDVYRRPWMDALFAFAGQHGAGLP